MNKEQLSNCCQSTFHVEGGEEGTNHYECDKCGNACNVSFPQSIPEDEDEKCTRCGMTVSKFRETGQFYCYEGRDLRHDYPITDAKFSLSKEPEEDYLDRFAEIEKGLGLEHKIAEKIANFIHCEIINAKKKAKQFGRAERDAEVKKTIENMRMEFTPGEVKEILFEDPSAVDGYNVAIDDILEALNDK